MLNDEVEDCGERQLFFIDLLDVMAVGNPTMQRMLSERRAPLGLPVQDPEESDPNRQQPSNSTNYFEDMCRLRRNLRYDGRLTAKRLSRLIRHENYNINNYYGCTGLHSALYGCVSGAFLLRNFIILRFIITNPHTQLSNLSRSSHQVLDVVTRRSVNSQNLESTSLV
ncbi:hypothetical protein YC2023_036207 [Brassica napus]